MKIFHELVEEVFINGPTSLPIKVQWPPVLGNIDNLRFIIVADEISGSSLLFTVSLYESPDVTSARAHKVKDLVSGVAPVVGQTNVYQAMLSDADGPISYSYNVGYTLTGTTPRAHVRIWVTGRGRA